MRHELSAPCLLFLGTLLFRTRTLREQSPPQKGPVLWRRQGGVVPFSRQHPLLGAYPGMHYPEGAVLKGWTQRTGQTQKCEPGQEEMQ